ncbi:ORF354 [White spot syndrome virus]|uniref:ORF354 n=2 Tax=White spot syndrome virus TaxID=342409 RepID=A0A2D3I584_9VIRU|nr:ORF354 [White spot syndrome virus]
MSEPIMRFIPMLIIALIAAFVIAALLTANSNYLDHNINKELNLTRSLQLRGTFTPEDIAHNNRILPSKLSVLERGSIILAEMDKYKNAQPTVNNSQERRNISTPQQQQQQTTPSSQSSSQVEL